MDWNNLNRDDIIALLETEDEATERELFARAYELKLQTVGRKVYFRGIIEFSNVCAKNCFYCGIRRDNTHVQRYTMTEQQVLNAARWAWEQRYGSIVMQSGERSDPAFVELVERLLRGIKELSNGELGITLSLGEQSADTYRRWFAAGAHRYLLRIESSNPALYASLHPEDHDWNRRLNCLHDLRETGYQVGTGVMIGLPGQTAADLADDIAFFRAQDIDMIGMGPYVVHHDTPLAARVQHFDAQRQLHLALRMIACTRLVLRDVNIASTTALQALDPQGREMGLQAGANIIMPVLTDLEYRGDYLLYDNKPCVDENASMCRACLERRIISVGEEVGYGQLGDSPHYFARRDA